MDNQMSRWIDSGSLSVQSWDDHSWVK